MAEGKTVAHNSGFKTRKLGEAEPILQELRLGKISRDVSLVDLYQEWLELKILPVVDRKRQRKNIFSVKTQLKDYLEIKSHSNSCSEYQEL